MDLEKILRELEQKGVQNDELELDKTQKYLNITRDTGEFLKFLVLATRSSKILEIGTSNGYSTIWLASSVPKDGSVTTIEYLKWKAEEALSNFEIAGVVNKIELLQEEAKTVTSPLDFIPVDMLDLRSNQLEMSNEKETFHRRTDYKDFKRRRSCGQYSRCM